MSHKPTPVLFVAGSGRSGSTLVGQVFASTPGTFSVGEVRHIWTRGLGDNWSCGCGAPFRECPFWSAVLSDAFGRTIDLARLRWSERRLLRLRAGVSALRWIREPERLRARHSYYLDALERLYRAIVSVSAASVVVDASKTPSYAALLSLLPSLDLRVLHLVRDPRATAYSWLNPKPSPDRGPAATMDRIGAAKSALLWTCWNLLAEAIRWRRPDIPVARLRYESLALTPETTLMRVRDRLVPELAGRPMGLEGNSARLVPTHTVSGNPDRLRVGVVTIAPDERWRSQLARRHRVVVTAIAGLGMMRYGYLRSPR